MVLRKRYSLQSLACHMGHAGKMTFTIPQSMVHAGTKSSLQYIYSTKMLSLKGLRKQYELLDDPLFSCPIRLSTSHTQIYIQILTWLTQMYPVSHQLEIQYCEELMNNSQLIKYHATSQVTTSGLKTVEMCPSIAHKVDQSHIKKRAKEWVAVSIIYGIIIYSPGEQMTFHSLW